MLVGTLAPSRLVVETDTLYRAGSAVKDLAVGDESGSHNPSHAYAAETPEDMRNETTAEHIGGTAENIAEFVAGDEALDAVKFLGEIKNVAWLAEHSFIAKAVE